MDTTRRTVLAGSAAAAATAGFAAGIVPVAGQARALRALEPPGPRARLSLDEGWRFHEGDIAFPPILDHEAAYAHAKAGNAAAAAADDYDDDDWSRVRLPHDWALGQPFDRAANIDQGFRRRGIGWYRRSFALDPADRDRSLELQFDGVATHATVWINGTLAHRQFGGFTGFAIDLSPFALFGDDLNTIAIRVDADATEGWWYEGAGLYRHAWLVKRARVHIVTDGVHADPRRDDQGRDDRGHDDRGRWTVPVAVTLDNQGARDETVMVEATLFDPDDRPVGRATLPVAIVANAGTTAHLSIVVQAPRLWSIAAPLLYRLSTRLLQHAAPIDGIDTTIGFRTIRFDADHGFFLNDAPLKIKGMCAHQDHAGVGVAVPDSLWDFRIRRLQAMGANALRCAHNPPAPELLEAADRLGMLVMDEHRELSAAADTLTRLAQMVRRDRNHPSVILWSLCNEESLQTSAIGVAMVRQMKTVVRGLDDSRPTTAALNGAMFAQPNIADELDVVGFNYGHAHYDRYHAAHQSIPLLSSEDTSAYMTRGTLRSDPAAHILADDDSEHAAWGLSHRDAWAEIATRPFMAGGFAWTGFDYRGEPTPFDWPSVGASFGAMDLCGFAKTAFHIRRALWTTDVPVLELSHHWTWPGREGEAIPIMAITNAERVVLRLNGRHIADLTVDSLEMAHVAIPYAPGRLEAIALRDGRVVAHRRVETAGLPVALRLLADRQELAGDGRDTVPVTVEALDARGRSVPIAQDALDFHITGGTILGVGNGDPTSHESDLPMPGGASATRRLFNGLAQILVQSRTAGHLTLVARGAGLEPATLMLAVVPHTLPAVQVRDGRQHLTEWRVAPAAASVPALDRSIAPDDMNSWAWLKPGAVAPGDPAARYVLFRLAFTPRRAIAGRGGKIVFARVAGVAQVWLDGRLVGTKPDPMPARLVIEMPAGAGEHVLHVLFDTDRHATPFGLAGSVTVGLTA